MESTTPELTQLAKDYLIVSFHLISMIDQTGQEMLIRTSNKLSASKVAMMSPIAPREMSCKS